MTENQKRIAIIAFVFIVILLLFVGGGNTRNIVNNGGAMPGLDLGQGPNINFGDRQRLVLPDDRGVNTVTRFPFVLPNLGTRNASNDLSAIGACCADCSGRSQLHAYVPATRGVTFVTNEGNKGPNIFNFFSPSAPVTTPTGRIYPSMRLNV